MAGGPGDRRQICGLHGFFLIRYVNCWGRLGLEPGTDVPNNDGASDQHSWPAVRALEIAMSRRWMNASCAQYQPSSRELCVVFARKEQQAYRPCDRSQPSLPERLIISSIPPHDTGAVCGLRLGAGRLFEETGPGRSKFSRHARPDAHSCVCSIQPPKKKRACLLDKANLSAQHLIPRPMAAATVRRSPPNS